MICIGKLVPNLIREQDNLLLEVMLPANFDENQEEAARILAPFLIVSNHVLFNFDDFDFKKSLINCVKALLRAAQLLNFSELQRDQNTDDPRHIVSGIMPKIMFSTA